MLHVIACALMKTYVRIPGYDTYTFTSTCMKLAVINPGVIPGCDTYLLNIFFVMCSFCSSLNVTCTCVPPFRIL